MQVKRSLLIAGAVTTLGLATTLGVSAYAMNGSSGETRELVSKLAQRFNLNQAEVQAVFDEYRNTEREANVSEYLQELVDKGKITAEQKTLIESKLKEISAAKDKEKAELEAWAKEKGVDIKYVIKGLHKDSDYLQKLVNKGEITTEQKTLIEAKQQELKTARETMREGLKKWAKDNGIDDKYLHVNDFWKGNHHKNQ